MRRAQLRVTRDVKGRQPDAHLESVTMDAGRQRMQSTGELLIRDPVAPSLPAGHPTVVQLDDWAEAIRRAFRDLWHPLGEEGRVARDVGFGHCQTEVIPAAPSTRD